MENLQEICQQIHLTKWLFVATAISSTLLHLQVM
jgi:hypothetical protein